MAVYALVTPEPREAHCRAQFPGVPRRNKFSNAGRSALPASFKDEMSEAR